MEIFSLIKKDVVVAKNLWRAIREDSLFKVGFILLFVCAMIVGLFMLFYDGFCFLSEFGGAGFMITRSLFSLFFLGLGMMLVMSSIVTSYSTFFRSRDLKFLVTSPFNMGSIAFYKFMESALISSWTFFFIIIPFAGAYALQQKIGFMFGIWVFIFTIPFIILCSAIGSLITLVVVRWIPRGKMLALLLLLVSFGAGYIYLIKLTQEGSVDDSAFVLSKIVPGLRLASSPILPSWWTAEGLKAFVRGDWARGTILLSVVVSNAMMICLLLYGIGKKIFFSTYQIVNGAHGTASKRRIWSGVISRIFLFFPRDMRSIIIKDIRTFFRDPLQWSQALIFFGLLAIYFMSIRSFHYDLLPQEWRNMITFLNIFSIAAVQCSLASRFVYPQLSLEGQAFWTLGLSPITVGRILLIKFISAFVAMIFVSVSLMLLSAYMLNIGSGVRFISLVLIIAISLAISALSTGLGAFFLDLKKTNSAAIVSGFGGTVNLVLSLGFILLSILPFALLLHFMGAGIVLSRDLNGYLVWCWGWLLLITLAVTVVPLYVGRRSMEERDY
jgi:ABC-2 type transport system permease protein